jgi:hypothetical protein
MSEPQRRGNRDVMEGKEGAPRTQVTGTDVREGNRSGTKNMGTGTSSWLKKGRQEYK